MTPTRRSLAVAMAIVALVVVAVVLLRPSDEQPAAVPAPAGGVAMTSGTTDPTNDDAAFPAPTVTAAAKAGAVEFAWTYPSPLSTDTHRVQVGPTAEAAQIADPVALTKATYRVTVVRGTSACLIATVLRSGQTSSASPAVCATAQ